MHFLLLFEFFPISFFCLEYQQCFYWFLFSLQLGYYSFAYIIYPRLASDSRYLRSIIGDSICESCFWAQNAIELFSFLFCFVFFFFSFSDLGFVWHLFLFWHYWTLPLNWQLSTWFCIHKCIHNFKYRWYFKLPNISIVVQWL